MKQLGEVLGVAESTISQYETGKRQPDNETLLRIGEFFGVTVGYILCAENGPVPCPASTSGIVVPVLGDVAAGIPMDAIENIVDYEEIDQATASTGEFFGLRVKGSSMEPRIREGDVVIVRKQEDADTGDTVVVLVNGDSATVKRIKKEPGGISLIPNNPAYDVQFYSNTDILSKPVTIIGKVVELRGKF